MESLPASKASARNRKRRRDVSDTGEGEGEGKKDKKEEEESAWPLPPEAFASLETGRMSRLTDIFLSSKTILTRSYTHMNITDSTCYMSALELKRSNMCEEEE